MSGARGAVAEPVLLGLVGHPVAHSVSPAIHRAALAAAGLAGVYVARDVPDEATLEAALAGLAPLGFTGVNVTVPHKRAVAGRCATLSASAAAMGAVNTVVVRDDGLHGDNTDGIGFLGGLAAVGIDPEDHAALAGPARAVVVGAGGAARAVAHALVTVGWDVTVVARRPGQARSLVDDLAPSGRTPDGHPDAAGPGTLAAGTIAAAGAAVAAASLVVNATPLGLHGESLPAPVLGVGREHVAYDLVYNPIDTPFLQHARRHGARVVDGLGMLVGQAAASFQRWTGLTPDVAAMDAAARRALATR